MKNKSKKRWNLSKSFLEFGELFLELDPQSAQDLVFPFVQAISQVYQQRQFRFMIGKDRYLLKGGRLHKERPKTDWSNKSDIVKIELLKTNHGQSPDHILFHQKIKLSESKKQFIHLICRQYALSMRNLLQEVHKDPFFMDQADELGKGGLKTQYRKQKSVILMIENYARKKNQKMGFFEDHPELTDEINQFQDRLAEELEDLRSKKLELEESYQSIKGFLKSLVSEMANRLAISLGLLEILSRNQTNKRHYDINLERIIYSKLLAQKNILDLLRETMEVDRTRTILVYEEIDALDLLHKSMALFSENSQVTNIEFEEVPAVGDYPVRANFSSMTATLRNLFEFLCQFHRFCSKDSQIKIRCGLERFDGGVKVEILLKELHLTPEQMDLLKKPPDIYDSIFFEQAPLSLYNYIIHQTAKRQGCQLSFSLKNETELLSRLELTNQ